jgi:Family of unknown function (DUF6263)
MQGCSTRQGGIALLAVVCCVLVWPRVAVAQVKLEYKFPEGKKLTYKKTSKIHQTLTLMGMDIEREEERSEVTSLSADKYRGDLIPVRWRVESLRIVMSLPGENLVFDTRDPKAKIHSPGLSFLNEMFELEGQLAFTIVLDKNNKVKAVEGAEDLQGKVEKLGPEARELMSRRFENEKLKRAFEQEFQILPDVLARPGEPWERTQVIDLGAGLAINFGKKLEYMGTEKRRNETLDKISSKVFDVKYNVEPDSNLPLSPVKSDLKVESSGGTIYFDREAGHVVSSTERIRIKGDVTYSAKGQEVASKLDLNIETSVELQPAKEDRASKAK